MHGGDPYRTPSAPSERAPLAPPREEAVIYGLVTAVGAIPVGGALADGVLRVAAMVGLVVSALGLAGLVRFTLAVRRARSPARPLER